MLIHFICSFFFLFIGDRYEGEWSSGKMHGRGVKYMANGDIYDGEWYMDVACGTGSKMFRTGDKHIGTYANDVRHGYGVYVWNNGDRFEGCWFEGQQIGKGTYYYANGDVYKGKWTNGKKHGRGILTSASKQMSFLEKWEHGIRIDRTNCKYYPTRLLKTSKEEALSSVQGHVNASNSSGTGSNKPSDHSRGTDTVRPSRSAVTDTIAHDTQGPNTTKSEEKTDSSSVSMDASMVVNGSSAALDTSNVEMNTSNCTDSSTDIIPPSTTRIPSTVSSTPPEDAACKVCFESRINTVFIRCGHMAVCVDCSAMLERCPICRCNIEEVIQTFKC